MIKVYSNPLLDQHQTIDEIIQIYNYEGVQIHNLNLKVVIPKQINNIIHDFDFLLRRRIQICIANW